MKYTNLSSLALATFILSSCNQAPDKNREQQVVDNATVQDTHTSGSNNTAPEKFSFDAVIKDYLALKNALTADDDKAAADAGKQLFSTLNAVDIKAIPGDKLKDYTEIADNAKENAEHIGANAGKIDHQREHLASLSKDMADLIELMGTTQKLYQNHCPMFNDGKGAVWISETKEIKNPYYGSKMTTCGSVQKEY
ncbi:MAG: hypothetical protein BGO31_08505 [Bacteroidetes bacterium 43-16]|nr:MAG: hypothetical protein BGO31_08505 [Bacteroidetes bacterium 43-16]